VGTFQEARLSLILTLGRYRDEEREETEKGKNEEIESGREKTEKNIIKTNAQFGDIIRNSESIKYLPVVLEALRSCVGDFNFTSDLDLGPHVASDSDSIFDFYSNFKTVLDAIQKDNEVEVEVEEVGVGAGVGAVMNINLT
jgi:hypothetical protein